MTLIFTLVIAGLSARLPGVMYGHLTAAGVPGQLASSLSGIPPSAALFAAFLGYNPMATLVPPNVLATLSNSTQATILGKSFFPQLLSGPFMDGLRVAFVVCVALSLAAAAASWMRGRRYIHDLEVASARAGSQGEPVSAIEGSALTAGK
jgi:hypothetical protein